MSSGCPNSFIEFDLICFTDSSVSHILSWSKTVFCCYSNSMTDTLTVVVSVFQRLCDYVCDLLLEESNVQPVSTPVTVCGDIHGQVGLTDFSF